MDSYLDNLIDRNIKENMYVDADDLIDMIANNFEPEDVFPDGILQEWAENNGYVKDELK